MVQVRLRPGIDNHSHSRLNGGGPVRSAANASIAVYVCICNGVTDHHIREAAANGCGTVSELTMRTGCGSTCGSCLDMAAGVLADHHARAGFPLPILADALAA
jgi:bacterioferritin-associated ferredoxin